MTKDHMVDSIEDAITLAETWRAAGTHTWFRGQAQTWQLVSSLGRRQQDRPAVEEVEQSIGQFAQWLKKVPELAYLLEEQHVHAFFAVMQHYGIPTPYIDFTTEPEIAAFFAVHDKAVTLGTQGCIIAINPDNFVDVTTMVVDALGSDPLARPEKVVVQVDGLWRMQAQAGHLLYQPIEHVEHYYGYDRILFLQDGRPYVIGENRIYPIDKSPLERKLDDFFQQAHLQQHEMYMENLFDRWRRQGITAARITTEDPDSNALLHPGTVRHPSWAGADLRWRPSWQEEYPSAIIDRPPLHLSLSNSNGPEFETSIAEQVLTHITSHLSCRTAPVTVIIDATRSLPSDLNLLLEKVWDGMRRLPYTETQLAHALARTTALLVDPHHHRHDDATRTLELASPGRVSTRACAPRAAVRAAYRSDLIDVLYNPDLAKHDRLLTGLVAPSLLFDFNTLVQLFAAELIPTQLAESPQVRGATFFSPTEVTTIGLP